MKCLVIKNSAIVLIVVITVLGCRRHVEVRPRESEVKSEDQDFFGLTPDERNAAKEAEGILKQGSQMTHEDRERLNELSEEMNRGKKRK